MFQEPRILYPIFLNIIISGQFILMLQVGKTQAQGVFLKPRLHSQQIDELESNQISLLSVHVISNRTAQENHVGGGGLWKPRGWSRYSDFLCLRWGSDISNFKSLSGETTVQTRGKQLQQNSPRYAFLEEKTRNLLSQVLFRPLAFSSSRSN